jgi:hypothetical protein
MASNTEDLEILSSNTVKELIKQLPVHRLSSAGDDGLDHRELPYN